MDDAEGPDFPREFGDDLAMPARTLEQFRPAHPVFRAASHDNLVHVREEFRQAIQRGRVVEGGLEPVFLGIDVIGVGQGKPGAAIVDDQLVLRIGPPAPDEPARKGKAEPDHQQNRTADARREYHAGEFGVPLGEEGQKVEQHRGNQDRGHDAQAGLVRLGQRGKRIGIVVEPDGQEQRKQQIAGRQTGLHQSGSRYFAIVSYRRDGKARH